MSTLLTNTERAERAYRMSIVGDAQESDITPEVDRLAKRLRRIHGDIKVAKEASGLHFYMASPACLEADGAVELRKMHLAVNVTKYLRDGQDRCALCMKTSTPYTMAHPDMYYRSLPGQFSDGPAGRIIFYIDQEGINRGWQSRILELDVEEGEDIARYYFNVTYKQWVPVYRRRREEEKFTDAHLVDGYEKWNPGKYVLGLGTKRNSCLMGFDAAVRWHDNHPGAYGRYCFLVEGGLDAGRIGPPAIAALGKHFSAEQAKLVAMYFTRVIHIKDNDAAGEVGREKVKNQLSRHPAVRLDLADPPAGMKDIWEMTYEAASQFAQSLL